MQIKDIEIKELIRTIEENAFCGRFPNKIYIYNKDYLIELKGYIYEPCYEGFSATHSITMNEETLFAKNSRNVEPYCNEEYIYGKFKTTEQAIDYIKECLKEQDIMLQYNKPNIEIRNNLNENESDGEIEL